MIMSGKDLDDLAEKIILNFQRGETALFPQTDIDRMAEGFLLLKVKYMPLSDDQTLLGLTTYDQASVHLTVEGRKATVLLDPNTVLLERQFINQWLKAATKQRLALQRRFTLAHECAHQILFRLEPEEHREELRKKYSARRLYSCRDLKTKEDWNEWQANTLGAALLMPRIYIQRYFEQYQGDRPLVTYDGKHDARTKLALTHLTGFFGVSTRAMEIRLKGLGLMTELPRWAYQDPFEIEGEDYE